MPRKSPAAIDWIVADAIEWFDVGTAPDHQDPIERLELFDNAVGGHINKALIAAGIYPWDSAVKAIVRRHIDDLYIVPGKDGGLPKHSPNLGCRYRDASETNRDVREVVQASQLWDQVVAVFDDKGFAENAEILVAFQECTDDGLYWLALALLKGDMREIQSIVDRASAYEKANAIGGCYNRLAPRRALSGEIRIAIDQPMNSEYAPPFPIAAGESRRHRRSRRFGATRHRRESRGRPLRRAGSRRVPGRSPGSGSSPPDEPEPALGRPCSTTAVAL